MSLRQSCTRNKSRGVLPNIVGDLLVLHRRVRCPAPAARRSTDRRRTPTPSPSAHRTLSEKRVKSGGTASTFPRSPSLPSASNSPAPNLAGRKLQLRRSHPKQQTHSLQTSLISIRLQEESLSADPRWYPFCLHPASEAEGSAFGSRATVPVRGHQSNAATIVALLRQRLEVQVLKLHARIKRLRANSLIPPMRPHIIRIDPHPAHAIAQHAPPPWCRSSRSHPPACRGSPARPGHICCVTARNGPNTSSRTGGGGALLRSGACPLTRPVVGHILDLQRRIGEDPDQRLPHFFLRVPGQNAAVHVRLRHAGQRVGAHAHPSARSPRRLCAAARCPPGPSKSQATALASGGSCSTPRINAARSGAATFSVSASDARVTAFNSIGKRVRLQLVQRMHQLVDGVIRARLRAVPAAVACGHAVVRIGLLHCLDVHLGRLAIAQLHTAGIRVQNEVRRHQLRPIAQQASPHRSTGHLPHPPVSATTMSRFGTKPSRPHAQQRLHQRCIAVLHILRAAPVEVPILLREHVRVGGPVPRAAPPQRPGGR